MPAFLAMVEGEEGYVGGVYFTPQAIHARRAVCDEWQDGEIGGSIVKRMPHFDQYENIGSVPMSDMMREGWWSECTNCGQTIALEYIDEDGNEVYTEPDEVIGHFGEQCFCNQKCQEAWKRKRKQEVGLSAYTENKMKAKVESLFGIHGITYTGFKCYVNFSKDAPYVEWAEVKFNVPECKHGGVSYRMDSASDHKETYQMFCAHGDQEAFAQFFQDRTGKAIDRKGI